MIRGLVLVQEQQTNEPSGSAGERAPCYIAEALMAPSAFPSHQQNTLERLLVYFSATQ